VGLPGQEPPDANALARHRTTHIFDASRVPPFGYFFGLFFVGNFLRLVLAKSRSCFSLIDLTICLEAPCSDDLDRFPRLAARAAPAAICCLFDLAGIEFPRLRQAFYRENGVTVGDAAGTGVIGAMVGAGLIAGATVPSGRLGLVLPGTLGLLALGRLGFVVPGRLGLLALGKLGLLPLGRLGLLPLGKLGLVLPGTRGGLLVGTRGGLLPGTLGLLGFVCAERMESAPMLVITMLKILIRFI
jgi:hypothetical protein